MKPTLKTISTILLLGLMCAGLSLAWQPSTQAQNPTFTPGSSDWDVYRSAARLTDPLKRIEALEKVAVDFPKSPVAYKAQQVIVNTLIQSSPEQTDRILKHVKLAIETASEFGRPGVCNDVATNLIDAGLLLDQAAELAHQALALTTTRLKDNELAIRSANLAHDTLLGTIYLKQGKIKEAEKSLLSAYKVYNPVSLGSLISVSMFKLASYSLAQIAEQEGQIEKALDYLVAAAILGKIDARLLPENPFLGKIDAVMAQRLESVYHKTHRDSLAGLEEMMDARYEKEFPLPVKPQPYQPTPARSDRAVLAEIFTGAACVPCVAVDLSFDAFLERYQRRDLIVLMYHQHVPQPDPMANPFTQARAKSYGVPAVPRVAIDGQMNQEGGGGRGQTKEIYDRLRPLIEKELETRAEAEIKLEAKMANSVIQVSVQVKPTRPDTSNLKLQIRRSRRTARARASAPAPGPGA